MDKPSFIDTNVELKNMTTFKAGGPAEFFCEPSSIDELKEALSYAKKENLKVTVLGAGSNVLISDDGIKGLVIRLGRNFSTVYTREENENSGKVYGEAGAMLSSLALHAVKLSLKGAEFACGIPGSVGGAVFMNAGAYGGEMKHIISSVDYLDEDFELRNIKVEDCDFGYRHSIFTMNPSWIVVGCELSLEKGVKDEIESLVNDLKAKRIKSQPLDVPSAGSTFKRPEGYFAGKLIEDSNLKGFALDDSGAQVSPKHAGFVVNNKGTASASDILKLISYVSDKVYEDSGVRLEPEVRMLGFS